MSTARALTTLASGFGSFAKGDLITGVPDEVIAVWVEAGVAAPEADASDASAESAPALDDLEAIAGGGLPGRRALVAIAKELGVAVNGKSPELVARIREARAAAAQADAEQSDEDGG